ncbi:hypothetical protein AB0D74_46605 [Streptomyces sp. NPDC048278]|uniref:hypothetical protein n=1 Tax=Streptomyces sp. NPDC048278 TaxID=3155809 RepID=UPI00342ED2FC
MTSTSTSTSTGIGIGIGTDADADTDDVRPGVVLEADVRETRVVPPIRPFCPTRPRKAR